MAESYTDEEIPTALRMLDAGGAVKSAATIRRLLAERNEAERVAKYLARLVDGEKVFNPITLAGIKAVALAYPDRGGE